MNDSLGLSIGMTNLVAARIGHAPVMRRSVLTLFSDRAPEVGVPGENPNLNQPGLVLSGFVERVGDPVPLVAADLITEPDAGIQSGVDTLAHAEVPDVAGADDPSLHFDGPVLDDAPVIETHADDWSHTAPEDHHLDADHSGFDIFDT